MAYLDGVEDVGGGGAINIVSVLQQQLQCWLVVGEQPLQHLHRCLAAAWFKEERRPKLLHEGNDNSVQLACWLSGHRAEANKQRLWARRHCCFQEHADVTLSALAVVTGGE
jgi:hypothetical protein